MLSDNTCRVWEDQYVGINERSWSMLYDNRKGAGSKLDIFEYACQLRRFLLIEIIAIERDPDACSILLAGRTLSDCRRLKLVPVDMVGTT